MPFKEIVSYYPYKHPIILILPIVLYSILTLIPLFIYLLFSVSYNNQLLAIIFLPISLFVYTDYKKINWIYIICLAIIYIFYIYFSGYLLVEIKYIIFQITIPCLIISIFFILYSFRMPFILQQLISSLKQAIFRLLVHKQNIHFYKPSNHQENYFTIYDPRELIYLKEGKEFKLENSLNKNFILLNGISYKNTDILDPYCDIIACKEAFYDENAIWLYFLILLISLNFIHSIYILFLLFLLNSFQLGLIFNIAIFLLFLTTSFLYMLFLFIKNIHFTLCNKSTILKSLKKDNSYLENSEDIDIDFFILKNRAYFSQKKALDDIDNIEKNILDKLKNIFQMAIPIFYLVHITIAIAYLTKDL